MGVIAGALEQLYAARKSFTDQIATDHLNSIHQAGDVIEFLRAEIQKIDLLIENLIQRFDRV